MIRSVVAIFVFALVLCAYIVNTGPAQRNIAGELAQLAAVSRAQTESLLPDTPLPEPTFLVPSTRLNLVPDSLGRTVDTILSDLGIRKRNVDLGVTENGTVLAEVSRVNGSALQYRTTLESMIVDAVQSAKNDRDIQESVNTAALKELFPVPASLVDTNGKIDTAALLDIIVNEAQVAAGESPKERFKPGCW